MPDSIIPEIYDFNPRSYKRSDPIPQLKQARLKISIHAPTRGATVTHGEMFKMSREISIHAPTRGATAKMHNNPYTYL